MNDVIRRPIVTLAAPYRREVRLEEAEFDSGMKMLRVIVREGHRITQLDLDRETAEAWGEAMLAWARRPDEPRESDPAAPAVG